MPSDDLSARLAKLSPAKRAVLEHMSREVADAATRSPIEAELVTIWREVFDNAGIGVTDSFHVLGGDSITSLRVAVRADAAGIRITSRQILEEETIERLARVAGTSDAWTRRVDETS
ncbi:phosphopantetheine-binding protein [Nocardia sp. NBC_01499]|uniref:phosphopantetheine-binding protein n=1 Tax=Nocardia sp. NBC_01499 TaxID=2903597 RepID=UPI0038655C3E